MQLSLGLIAVDPFKRHKQLTFADTNKFQIAIFVFQSLNNLLPSVFMDYFKYNSELHRHFTRSAHNLHTIRYNTNTRYISIKVINFGDQLCGMVWIPNCVKLVIYLDLSAWLKTVCCLYTTECFWTNVNMNYKL